MVFRFRAWDAFILRKRKLTRSLRFIKTQMILIVYVGVHSKMTSIKVFSRQNVLSIYFSHFRYLIVTFSNFTFYELFPFTVFTVKEIEKLPNLKIESPPKEIAKLSRKGASNWQCEGKDIRDLCEKTLLKVRHRVEERRIMIKQFFKDYDRYMYIRSTIFIYSPKIFFSKMYAYFYTIIYMFSVPNYFLDITKVTYRVRNYVKF